MLTFEKILSVFENYLTEDTMYEVLMTSRGCTVMEWDDKAQDWDSAKICRTPEDLKAILLEAYSGYLAYKITLGHRPMTDDEQRTITTQVEVMDRSIQ